MAIARSPVVVIDCPDPVALAEFYAAVLGWEIEEDDDEELTEWVDLSGDGPGQVLSFQRVEGFKAPVWPGQDHPQQVHLDLDVDDLDSAELAVLELGAVLHDFQPGTTFRVFLDPAGHPFCLCLT